MGKESREKMTNIKKNFIYNLIYQILILIIPLVTAPYLARKIGVTGLGIYSYTYSIVYYFMLISLLGLNNYGNRTIAKVRDKKEELSRNFWEIYIGQLLLTLLMIILYLIYVNIFAKEYYLISLIEVIFIFSSMLDINWLFFGLEKFKITILRSGLLKILSLVLIFIFVKKSSDLIVYVIIMSITTLLSQVIIWPFLKKYILFIRVTKKGVIKHFRPNLTLFVPVIAVSLYKVMDKIMLGMMSNINEVGYFESAEDIINVPGTIITALGTIMLPKISNMISNKLDINKYIEKSLKFIMFLSFPMLFGLVLIAKDFSIFYYGKAFEKVGVIIQLLSITIPFSAFASVIRTQYLIPNELDKEYIVSVLFGAIVNLVINTLIIGTYMSIGACIGTIFAEFSVMFVQIIYTRKKLNLKKYYKFSLEFMIKSLIMFLIIIFIKYYLINISWIYEAIIAIFIYTIINIKYIYNEMGVRDILCKIKINK